METREIILEIMEAIEGLKNPFPEEFLPSVKGAYYSFETCRSLILSTLDETKRKHGIPTNSTIENDLWKPTNYLP